MQSIVKLIINSDDFGLHGSIDESVEFAHREGILTSASLAVTGESFDNAVKVAKANRGLGVGIHLTFIGEKPVRSPKSIPSLVDEEGRFFEDHGAFCSKIMTGRIHLEDVAAEAKAQIERFMETGLKPTHLDSHRHLHVFPPVFIILEPLLKKYGISKIRWINPPLSDYRRSDLPKAGYAVISRVTRFLASAEFAHPDSFIGFFESGRMDTAYLKGAIRRLKPGVTEIAFHPGSDNEALNRKYGIWKHRHNWKGDWEGEFKALLDPEVRHMIKDRGIRLISYADL